MATKQFTQLSSASASALSENTVFPVQDPNLATPQSRKVVAPQVRLFVVRIDGFTSASASSATPTAQFLMQDAAIDANPHRIVLDQMQALMARRSRVTLHQETPKVGTTSGWVVAAANNLGKMATLPASQTAATLVVPLSGFPIGDTITAFSLSGSLQSGGNTASITADLRVLTAATGGATDASVGSLASPVSVTANTILSASNAIKSGLSHVVAAGESFYVLLTATTGSGCTEELQAIAVTTTGS